MFTVALLKDIGVITFEKSDFIILDRYSLYQASIELQR